MKRVLLFLTRNPLSLLGTALTTASAVLILSLLVVEAIGGFEGSPYLGIIVFLILPGLFVAGLLLIPLGHWRQRRRELAGKATKDALPVLNLNEDNTRRGALLFLVATIVNVVILGTATFKGIEVSESPNFCGQTCHKVMEPEFTVWQRSPHSRVQCVSCHIGPGASWFVKSKLSGSWQVVSVLFNLYPRPIPSPVHNLRPARETCEQCHWPTKFVGDRLKQITHYESDETNGPRTTVLLVRVGGKQGSASKGIHWHVDPGVTIRYRSDEKRERIDEIELTRADGTKTVYKGPAPQAENGKPAPAATVWRAMDCVDCHNRPTHIYRTPESAVDGAIVDGRVDRALPFVRREALRLVQVQYASHDEGRAKILAGLKEFYAKNYADLATSKAAAIDDAGKAIGEAWAVNVFPGMNVQWGTYTNHIGHQGSPGCFRCHDDEHKSADGHQISQDCNLCHALLAQDEEHPEILKQLNP